MDNTVEFPMKYRNTDEIKIVVCLHQWKSINQMPPFNTQLLITDGKFIVIAEVHIITDAGLSWLTRFDGVISAGKYQATHWMRLPELPEIK